MARKKTAVAVKEHFWHRHPHLKHIILGTLAFIAIIVLLITIGNVRNSMRQSRLDPFYSTKGLSAKGIPGQVVRQEPLGIKVDGGKGIRVLYRTQRADSSYTFSSGMVFIPDGNATGKRPILAWAHGTLGLGDACAPTRTADPAGTIAGLSEMLKRGWVVTATDYAGFGTPGTQGYLVGGDEAHDVLNSVRAARSIAGSGAGDNFAVWGHSQGGNSALFSQHEAAAYAPELHLTATVASAPAAELIPLLQEQYGTLADWVIGPLVATSWPAANSNLDAFEIMTVKGRDNYQRIASHCIAQSTLGGFIRQTIGQKFFRHNPIDIPAWRAMAAQQSAPLPGAGQPLLIVESKTDKVVLPNTTALYIQQACGVDENITTLWLEKASHQDIPKVSADSVINWISERFAGNANGSSCNEPLPFKPASVPS